jgi:glycosyltransferase A (GT-A) superfamily protein (DUF2064 family)
MRCALVVLLLATACPVAVPAQTPTVVKAEDVDSRTIAKNLANRLVSDFVYPEQGKRYAAMLNLPADLGPICRMSQSTAICA